ncbi:hypothetical protein, partial [Cronobacter sakazakii]
MHPDDAARYGVREGDPVEAVPAQGFMVGWAAPDDAQAPG